MKTEKLQSCNFTEAGPILLHPEMWGELYKKSLVVLRVGLGFGCRVGLGLGGRVEW